MSASDRAGRRRRSGLWPALVADARINAALRGEREVPASRLGAAAHVARLALVSDAFLAQVLYRIRVSLRSRRVPVLPWLLHRLSIVAAGVHIGDRALVHPGVYIVHGQVVVAGAAQIGRGVTIFPTVTIGPDADGGAPMIGAGASLGAGCRVLGPIEVGPGAKIGANAVVTEDVPAGSTAVGVPTRPAARSERDG